MTNRTTTAAAAVLLGFVLVAGLAGWFAPADPLAQTDVLRTRFLPPLSQGPDGLLHLLGTDRFGRDLLSRLMYGARISLLVGFLSVGIASLVGLGVGVGAAVLGPAWDRVLMGVTNAALSLPRLVLLLALVAAFEPSVGLVVLVLGLTGWMTIARLARAECRKVLGLDYLVSVRAAGVGPIRIVTRHLLPNILTPVIVAGALSVGNAITLESGLAFLGLGVPPPAPSWGNMIAGGRDALVNAPWIAGFPGLAIITVVMAINLVGDGLRDRLDPQAHAGEKHMVTTSRGAAVNDTREASSTSSS